MTRAPLYLSVLCLAAAFAQPTNAQDNSSAPATPAATQTPTNSDPASKKVWTNEDVPDLRSDSPISTVGNRNGGQANSGLRANGAAGRKDANWYRDQILKLQNQLPTLNNKIAQLQAGIDGKFTGDAKTSTRPEYANGGDWRTELAQLQKKRDDIESKIDGLRDQARHAGVPPNTLP